MHTNEPVIKHKVGLLNPAEKLANVSKACQVTGLSQDTFCRNKREMERTGVGDSVHKRGALPFFEREDLPMLRILTNRGTENCGKAGQHDQQPYLALNDIEHTIIESNSPKTNGI